LFKSGGILCLSWVKMIAGEPRRVGLTRGI
jgi:hypothetical protein